MQTFLSAQWNNLVMANYIVPPAILEKYLPHGVELDTYMGDTYVSLVGFMFNQTRLFNIPIPFLGTFEEINLRFYVKRIEGNLIKRGVVFINESVPFKSVAWIANRLYNEQYVALPTKNFIDINDQVKKIRYEWQANKTWNHLAVSAQSKKERMQKGSIEEFIFEHYYGYNKVHASLSQEYRVNHPAWMVNPVLNYQVKCDFEGMYGKDFSLLTNQQPASVLLAEGSPVTIDWQRRSF